MKKIHSKWLKGGLLGLLAVFGLASCSDDHYDINTTNATSTLWENIVASNQCDSFAMILEKTIVNKKSYGIPATLSYKGLLSSNRVFTVWAPKDGTYNAQHWLNLLAAGDNETVETQFVKNHIANFNFNGSYPTVQKLLMYNGKYVTYDVPNNTLKGIAISTDAKYKNVASTNGTLHVLDGIVPFTGNIRELMAATTSLSDLYKYVKDNDTLIFKASSSVPGSTVNGEIQYVDSFYEKSNKVMPSIAMNEDSLSGAIIPSNTAWQEAIAKISPFYTYKTRYGYWDTDASKWVTDTLKADSLQDLYSKKAIFNNMFYSLYEQKGFDVKSATVASVQTFFNSADSLVSTTTYGKTYGHQMAPYCRTLSEGKVPLEGSNGYAFITDHFNFKANKAWQYDIIIEGEDTWRINLDACNYMGTPVRHQLNATTRNDSVPGTVRSNEFVVIPGTNSAAKPTVSYKIPDVLAGTYDVYVVIVPQNMDDASNKSPKPNQFSATMIYDYNNNGSTFKAHWISETATTTFKSDASKVDTILLFKDFKFPYAYANVSNCYPMISLTSIVPIADRKYINNELYIDCFILKSKDE